MNRVDVDRPPLRSAIASLLLATACAAPSDARVWRGLPYAAPPTGERRWRAPREASGWEGVREALSFAERCVQLTNAYDEDEGLAPGLAVGSEDCLTLDVYAPPGPEVDLLPLMVWILRLDAAGYAGIEVVTGSDSIGALAAGLVADARLDAADRCWIVEEAGRWMFGRRMLPELREATECARTEAHRRRRRP